MITDLHQLANALANNASRFVVDKAAIANQTTGQMASLWRATGTPGQAAIPGTTPAVPTSATLGAIPFVNQTAPNLSYLGWLALANSLSAVSVEIHDRLAHVGGLSLNLNTLQTITGLDLATIGVAADRVGPTNYSDVQWWLEVYSDGGATASNATVNVTYHDGSSGNLSVIAVGGTLRAGRLISLTSVIPPADQGKYIRRINNVTLSAATGTAGNFGFTATRWKTAVTLNVANKVEPAPYDLLNFPDVPNDSCLFLATLCASSSTGAVRGAGKIIHG